jgi:hypothetical protein
MATTTAAPVALMGHGVATPAALDALVGAVTTEIRLLEDLIGIMRGQRRAVADDDLQGVDDSVYATHRVLVTLAEARRRRRSLNQILGGSEDLPLRALEEALGERVTDEVRFARDGLRAAAITLSQEVELNRHLLREALAAGNDLVRAIYGPAEPRASYEAPHAEPEARGGLLLNRRA